jgi:hypothetical protein
VNYNVGYHEDEAIGAFVGGEIARAQNAAEILSGKTGKSTFDTAGRGAEHDGRRPVHEGRELGQDPG